MEALKHLRALVSVDDPIARHFYLEEWVGTWVHVFTSRASIEATYLVPLTPEHALRMREWVLKSALRKAALDLPFKHTTARDPSTDAETTTSKLVVLCHYDDLPSDKLEGDQ